MYSNLDVDRERLVSAERTAHARLLAEVGPAGHWIGELSSSPLATATAVSALTVAEQHIDVDQHIDGATDSVWWSTVMVRNELSELLTRSLRWLADQQNADGGWGDARGTLSNISATMLVEAAFHLTGVPAKYSGILERARAYVESQGGVPGLKRRYGKDKTFAAPILTNCALAGLVPWNRVPALPFELACCPPGWFHRLKLPVVSYAIPALVAIGQARHHHRPSWNPLLRGVRNASRRRSLQLVEAMQPESGGFLEATPLTSFVVMSLASVGQADGSVVRRGVEFLLASIRSDGSWPIDANLATWNTSQALCALDWQLTVGQPGEPPGEGAQRALAWLLACQHQEPHPYTGAAPGGWAWTDLPGGVPDADDTAGALLALAAWRRRWPNEQRDAVGRAAINGVRWLLGLQNRDGGFPTFCRGWGTLPFDRSSTDITAHVVRGLHAWQRELGALGGGRKLQELAAAALERGVAYLVGQQRPEGSWAPLWFGNQYHAAEENLVYGTAKVLVMYDELGRGDTPAALRARAWLAGIQLPDGGWGPAPAPSSPGGRKPASLSDPPRSSVEETALAVEALLPAVGEGQIGRAVGHGLDWLMESVETSRYIEPSAIGFYFAKLWYYERLYPQIYAVRTLARACDALGVRPAPATASAR